MSKRRQSVGPPSAGRGRGPTPPSRSPDPRARVRVTDPSDLLALVPYLLGFHPQESVVAVLVRSGQVILTARVDLPPAAHLGALVNEFGRLATQHRAAELVLVAYSEADPDVRTQLAEVVAGLSAPRVSEAIVVTGDRWWSLMCSSPCCPPQGRPYEVESHRLAAEAVYAGMSARPGRADLEALVAGPDQTEAERLEELAAALRAELSRLTRAQIVELVHQAVGSALGGASPDRSGLLQLAVATTDLYVRDLAWALISRTDARQHVQLWVDVVAVAPPGLASAPLALLGLAAWISGDGALQNCCVERLERLDPEYSLGTLLGEISARALSPTLWDELQTGLRAELGSLAGS